MSVEMPFTGLAQQNARMGLYGFQSPSPSKFPRQDQQKPGKNGRITTKKAAPTAAGEGPSIARTVPACQSETSHNARNFMLSNNKSTKFYRLTANLAQKNCCQDFSIGPLDINLVEREMGLTDRKRLVQPCRSCFIPTYDQKNVSRTPPTTNEQEMGRRSIKKQHCPRKRKGNKQQQVKRRKDKDIQYLGTAYPQATNR